MTPPFPEPLDRRRHRVDAFACGNHQLDDWLKRYAGQGERRDTTRTFVHAGDDGVVFGYYTLVVGSLSREDATTEVAKGTPAHFRVPVCLIARLAVDQTAQGRRLGSWLLLDALRRVLVVAENAGTRAVVVDAIDDNAASFYAKWGFQAGPRGPLTMMMPLQTVRSVITAVGTG